MPSSPAPGESVTPFGQPAYNRLITATRWLLATVIVFGTLSSLTAFTAVIPTSLHWLARLVAWVGGVVLIAWTGQVIRDSLASIRRTLPNATLPDGFWPTTFVQLIGGRRSTIGSPNGR
jgi:hypothetical protein